MKVFDIFKTNPRSKLKYFHFQTNNKIWFSLDISFSGRDSACFLAARSKSSSSVCLYQYTFPIPPESHSESHHGHMHTLSMIIFLSTCLFVFHCSNEWGVFASSTTHSVIWGAGGESPMHRRLTSHLPPHPPPYTPPPRPLHLFFSPPFFSNLHLSRAPLQSVIPGYEVWGLSMLCTSSLTPATFRLPHKNLPNWTLLFAKWLLEKKSSTNRERQDESRKCANIDRHSQIYKHSWFYNLCPFSGKFLLSVLMIRLCNDRVFSSDNHR